MIDAETFLKSYDSDSNPVIESVNESNAESDNENVQKCRHSALRILNAAAQSCRSLEDKLEKKGFDRRTAEKTVTDLKKIGFLNDKAFAENIVDKCLKKHSGIIAVRHELLRKGIEGAIAENLISETIRQDLFRKSAFELAETVIARNPEANRETRLKKFWSAAKRKGHNFETANEAAREMF